MRTICFLLSCCWAISAIAQDFKQDFWEVYHHHQNRESYTQEVFVNSYAKNGDTKPIYHEKGKIVKGKNTYYSLFSNQETIIDGKYFLFINHEEKRMIYYDKLDVDATKVGQSYLQGLDSVDKSQVTYIGSEGKLKIYKINHPKQMIKTTELYLNMDNKMVEKIVYYYQSIGKHESVLYKTIIDYKLVSTEKPSTHWFDWKKYIFVKDNKAELNTAYKQFKLTQHQEKKMDWDKLFK